MKRKKIFTCMICLKFSLLVLLVSLFILPRFVWRTDTMLTDVQEAIRKRENLEKRNEKGATPLIGASSQGMLKAVKLLLENGAKIEAHANNPDDQILEAGNTALHYACLNGNPEMVKLLVDHGASVFSLNDNKNSPLYTLVNSVDTPLKIKEQCIDYMFQGRPETARNLLNLQNKQGYTPLMRVAELRNPNFVELILQRWGKLIDFGLKNKSGETTLGVALRDAADDTIIGLIRQAQNK